MIALIRHAEVAWVDEATETIIRDPSLSPRGRDQLPHLCSFLARFDFDHFVYSPQSRVVETLEHVNYVLSCPVEKAPWLEEIRYPDWESEKADAVVAALQHMDAADCETRWRGHDGGESLRSYTRRVRHGAHAFLGSIGITRGSARGLWRLESDLPSVGMLGHIGSLSIATGVLLGLPSTSWERQRFPLRQASVTHIEPIRVGDEYAFAVIELGRDDFIPEHLRSAR